MCMDSYTDTELLNTRIATLRCSLLSNQDRSDILPHIYDSRIILTRLTLYMSMTVSYVDYRALDTSYDMHNMPG